jgi:hypothetical protein
MGACMGCSPAMAFGVALPERTRSLVLYWPVGGAHYRLQGHARAAEHLAYVEQHGLHGVVSLVATEGKTYNQDPRGGFWASVIARDPVFATDYMRLDVKRYKQFVTATRDSLFDRDTSPGAEPEDLFKLDVPALVVPGQRQIARDPRRRVTSRSACRAPNTGISRWTIKRSRTFLRGCCSS